MKNDEFLVVVYSKGSWKNQNKHDTGTIIIFGLYISYPILEGQNRFLRSFFCKFSPLCMVSIQEWFIIKSRLWWHVYDTKYSISNIPHDQINDMPKTLDKTSSYFERVL